jgi:predicted dehydrogenase
MKKLRLGVVGAGYIGELHAGKYSAMGDVDLVGIADINFERAQEMARKYNTNAYDSYSGLVPHVDGLSLTVPTISHFDLGNDILNHGIHLLIEKPITLKPEHADTLIETAKKNHAVLQVGHIERFNPAVIKMESFISRPALIESHRLSAFTKRGTDVDIVLDLMIHDLDIILHIVRSEIKEIDATGMSVISDKIDVASARIAFFGGAVANLTASRVSSESHRVIRVFQPDINISVDCGKRKINLARFASDNRDSADSPSIVYEEEEFPNSDPLNDQIRSFLDAIKNGTTPRVSGVDGRRALAVALDIIDRIKRK